MIVFLVVVAVVVAVVVVGVVVVAVLILILEFVKLLRNFGLCQCIVFVFPLVAY